MKRFNIRVYGIVVYRGKILLSHENYRDREFTKFPGGGLEWGENTHECLVREFKEELNIDVEPGFLFHVTESFQQSKFYPEDQVIGIFYAANHNSSRIFISNEDLTPEERIIVSRYRPKCVYEEFNFDGFPPESIPDGEFTRKLLYLRDSLLWDQGLVIRNNEYKQGAGGSVMWLELSYLHCIDCRVYGSNIKPDWWGSIQ